MEDRRITRQGAVKRRRLGLPADDEQQTPNYDDAGRHRRQEQDQAEEDEEEEEKFHFYDDPKEQSKLPNLAAHFAALTNAVLQRIRATEVRTSDSLYDEFMLRAKTRIIGDLKKTYNDLHYFYVNPFTPMPTWLSASPPGKQFYILDMDVRLYSRVSQMKKELSSFFEEQGFVPPKIDYMSPLGSFQPGLCVHLQLDVARVSTKKVREHVDETLLKLEVALR